MTSPIRPITSCDRFSDALADFLEREVSEATRGEMEAHALSCDDCGPLLADLRRLRIEASSLEPLAPSRDLWAGISERIEAPVVSIGTVASDRQHVVQRRRMSVWVGLAAAGLVAVTATATYQITKQSLKNQNVVVASVTEPAKTPATLTSPTVDSSNKPAAIAPSAVQTPTPKSTSGATPAVALASNQSGKLSPAQTYDQEISRLRRVVDRRRKDLDSSTVVVLEKNLHIIDEAIKQCRKALEKDPSSSYLNESLTDALDNKVQLLRAAATLPAGS
ncbi:MAG TPA: zf-HC2 domain-containing protein [Gemmatimonadaceae bacterium]|jgi:hypothetical protein